MIYTLTLNPSLDYIMKVSDILVGKTNRSEYETILAGGKGINVSTILKQLGSDSVALGFVAGFTGDHLVDILKERNLNCDFIKLKEGMTRINVKLKASEETEINGAGPVISEDELNALFTKLDTLTSSDILIMAGSVPACLPSNIYETIILRLKDKGVKFVVDASKKALLETIKHHPFFVKPNHDELEELFDIRIENNEQLIEVAGRLLEMGACNVLVSLGKDGAMLLDEFGHIYTCQAPSGKLINSVGSGDSMVAGFLYGYSLNHDYKQALKFGNICGGANAFCEDLATKEMIEEVAKQNLEVMTLK